MSIEVKRHYATSSSWPRMISNATSPSIAVRLLLGVILLAAASLKGFELATGPIAEDSLLWRRWFFIAVVELELFLGLWLLSGIWVKWAWRVSLAVFFGFAAASFSKGLMGDASCGCFGRVPVSPWWTLTMDMVAVAALARWPPAKSERLGNGRAHATGLVRTGHVVTAFLVIGCPAFWAMASYRPALVESGGRIIGDSNVILLEPEKWIGKPLPIAAHIDIGPQLNAGLWILLMHRHDCPECQDAIPQYRELAQDLSRVADSPKIALIAMPPHGTSAFESSGQLVEGRLSDSREWFVTTPVEILLRNGKVTGVSTDLPALKANGDFERAMAIVSANGSSAP